jgi:predicted dehydrogenase
MSEKKLKTACLGLDQAGQFLLETASKIDFFEIVAVADRDIKLVEKNSLLYNCDGFDDFRQLLIQKQFDCLFVAPGPYSIDEYVRSAMKKGCSVLKLSPAARNFEGAAEFVKLAAQENVKFAVAEPARFTQSFIDFSQYLQQKKLEQPFLIDARFSISDSQLQQQYNDPGLSGGGVLLRNSFNLIDQIVLNFHLPQQLYCLCTNSAAGRQQRSYLAEETAVVAMRFNDSLMGSLITSRQKGIGPDEQFLAVHSPDRILTVSPTLFKVTDSCGKPIEQQEYDYDKAVCFAKVLNNFAMSILGDPLSPGGHKLITEGQSYLPTMAVIEAAYLSARTAMPEEPARVMQMIESQPTFSWPAH